MSQTHKTDEVTEALDNILGGLDSPESSGPDEIIKAVQEIPPDALYDAMLVDQNAQRDNDDGSRNGVIDKIAELEEAAGGPAEVEVTKDGFTADDISVVGANLNKNSSDDPDASEDKITLVVSEPKGENHVIPELYNSTIAVSFSMELQENDETYKGQLKVPVQVTLPIPDTINPDFLVILHYGQDGGVPVPIYPHIFKGKDGRYFASFVLDHFSDFAMVMLQTSEQEPASYTITVTASPAAGGTVSGGGEYGEDAAVTVTANANSGYRFVGWEEDGAIVNTGATYEFTAKANRTLTAVFERINTGGGSIPSNPSYQITIPTASNGTVTVTPASARSGAKVTITATPDEGYKVDMITVTRANGREVEVTDTGDGTTYTFTMPTSQVTVSVTFAAIETPWVNPFTDVSESDWFYDAVAWGAQEGVVKGTSTTSYIFSPFEGCTRAQFVTFLWRAADEKEPTSTMNKFSDVSATTHADYYKAILWAAENGITTGTDDGTTFSPNEVVTRAQAVTLMHRYAKLANIATKTGIESFDDVTNEGAMAPYYDAIGWATANGITNGNSTTANTFDPMEECNRGMMVTFLYRLFTDATA